jgi:hypothetical protein
MIAIAARSGISLGLNLKRKNDSFDMNSRETRKQVWWSIFRLENLLSVMTGRNSCLGSSSSTLPPPLPFPNLVHTGIDIHQNLEKPSAQLHNLKWTMHTNAKQLEFQRALLRTMDPNSSLYHFYLVDLSLITHAVGSGVYTADNHGSQWHRVENRIALYGRRMNDWVSNLHPSFSFQDIQGNPLRAATSPFQISLAISYYSGQIVLNRPCLSRPAVGRKSGNRLPRSRFSNLSALACVRYSLAAIALLPEQASIKWCFNLLQWWEFLHVLTQATTILLLDLTIGPVPTKPGEVSVDSESIDVVLSAAKKGLLWLHCLSKTSESARRAFRFGNRCIQSLAARRGFDLTGIPPAGDQAESPQAISGGYEIASTQRNPSMYAAQIPQLKRLPQPLKHK